MIKHLEFFVGEIRSKVITLSVTRRDPYKKHQNMAQQQQIPYINMSQTQKQDEKEQLLKLYPRKLSRTFSILQLVFGVVAIFWQVSLSKIY